MPRCRPQQHQSQQPPADAHAKTHKVTPRKSLKNQLVDARTCHFESTDDHFAPTIVQTVVVAGQVVGFATAAESINTAFQDSDWTLVHKNLRRSVCPLNGVPVGAEIVMVPAAMVACISHSAADDASH